MILIMIIVIKVEHYGRHVTWRLVKEGDGKNVVDYDATHHTEKGAVTLRSGRGR